MTSSNLKRPLDGFLYRSRRRGLEGENIFDIIAELEERVIMGRVAVTLAAPR